MNNFNYVEQFRTELQQKYARELKSAGLTTGTGTGGLSTSFVGTNTIKIPRLQLGGYMEHSRLGGWNRQNISNDFEIKKLEHDRNVEFYVDAMDVDETNQIVSMTNITNVFETEHAIPELDAYRFSKLYTEFADTFEQDVDHTALTADNVLTMFDQFMEEMDEDGVPESGRILYVTSSVATMIKNAGGISRSLSVTDSSKQINRMVDRLDDVPIVPIPGDRFYTGYDFTEGFKPDTDAVKMNMVLVHPSAVIAVQKHNALYMFPPGSHTGGDGYLYQNRRYGDLFLIENKVAGVKINAPEAGA